MQFGHITLFATAFPAGAFFSLVMNCIESRTDLYKILFLCRRPIPRAARSIGSWNHIMMGIAICAVLSNTFLLVFVSGHGPVFAPSWFDAEGHMESEDDRMVVTVMFLIEHALLFITGIVWWNIPNVPTEVMELVRKKKYVISQGAQEMAARRYRSREASGLVEPSATNSGPIKKSTR